MPLRSGHSGEEQDLDPIFLVSIEKIQTLGEQQGTKQAEMGATHLQVKECRGWHRLWRKGRRGHSPSGLQEKPTLPMPRF